MIREYETVIGLEVHVELNTKMKIFCGCSTEFGAEPNTHICPVCTGMPGALPVLNKKVVEYALAAGEALHCRVNRRCRFDRKNYFYPDNPQNYQISQLYLPICQDGWLEIETGEEKKKIRIHEMHMEEDAGKLIHDEWEDCTLVDYNRSGVPLLEIVSEPDMSGKEEVLAYLDKLRTTLKYLGISDCRLQEGSMRADVNLSVRERGSKSLGTRTEMKNLNSFKAIARAIDGERERQIELLEMGKAVEQETRRWDDNKESSRAMRSKEDAKDYRYFPDPDLPELSIDRQWIDRIRKSLPEMREEKQQRYQEQYGLSEYDARLLTQSRPLAELFEETLRWYGDPKKAANWFLGDVQRLLKENALEPEQITFSPEYLGELLNMLDQGTINQPVAHQVFEQIFLYNTEPRAYVEARGLALVQDTGWLKELVIQVRNREAEAFEKWLQGQEKVLGFLVGQVMKEARGKADPVQIKKLFLEEKDEDDNH